MNNLNSVLIEGTLTAAPVAIAPTNGQPNSAIFTVATYRFFNQDNERRSEISFFNVEVWNKTAELCLKTLNKGSGVRVVGRLKQVRWVDDVGLNQERVILVADQVEVKPEQADPSRGVSS